MTGDKKPDYHWEELYRDQEVEELPWYLPGLDPDFDAALTRHSVTAGKVLDICTGPATQAMALAERGFKVFATDISATAISKARITAAQRGLKIAFRQADIMKDDLGGEFDVLVDRGCFHVFGPDQRPRYVSAAGSLLKPGGLLILKCFSHKEKRRDGPYRFTPRQLKGCFSPTFEILSIEDTRFTGASGHTPRALISVMRKP